MGGDVFSGSGFTGAGFIERPAWPGDADAFRTALHAWIADRYRDDLLVRDWWQELAAAGLTAPTWPRAHGGLGMTTRLQEIVEEELAANRRVAPPINNDGFRVVAPALRQFLPTDDMAIWLEPLLAGAHRWTALVDEPPLGGDDSVGAEAVAGDIRSTSVRDWKYVTLDAVKIDVDPLATHAVLVTRSDPASSGRRGLTCFLVDLRDDSVTRDGTLRIEGMRVLPDRVLGDEHQGWEIVKFTSPYAERSLAGRIRRGMVHLPAGEIAGALDLTLADAIHRFPPPEPPGGDDRRRR